MPNVEGRGPQGGGQQYLTFLVGDRRYALAAEQVAEVIRIPLVARLPRSPGALMGLANLRGSVVPVVSLPTLLGQAQAAPGGSARAIILKGTSLVAVVVDVVESLRSPEPDQIDTRQAALTAEPVERLAGVFAIPASESVARILDLEKMLVNEFGNRTAPTRAASRNHVAPMLRNDPQVQPDRLVLISFDVAGQEYALPLETVQEVIAVPATMAVVPFAEAVLLGVVTHRDGLLPLLSLRALLGFTDGNRSAGREKAIITRIGGIEVGLVADRMRAVISADLDLIEPSPSILAARAGGEARIGSMYRGDGGRRLISILAADGLFREDVMRRLRDAPDLSGNRPTTEQQDSAETIQFLVFRLGTELFGLPIGAVDEVARVPDRISRLPNAPEFLEGVVNLRGDVLPVIDQRKRFGLPAETVRSGLRLVVVRSVRHRAGLIVDGVLEVLRSSPDAVEPAPELIAGAANMVNRVINLPDRGQMILLLDVDELLTDAEHDLLEGIAAGSADRAGL
jgi:purine-binding chemotaxis protein CheW